MLLAGLGGAASDAGRELGVLVDCDTGLGRTGVASPDEAAELAGAISRTPGLRFAGLLTFLTPSGAPAFLEAAADLIRRRGLPVETVSAGGTPTMWRSGELRPLVSEYRAGTKALSSERAADGFGLVLEAPGSQLVRLDEEHGYVELAAGEDLELGAAGAIVPNHVCLAVNLADELVAARGDEISARWPVERGR